MTGFEFGDIVDAGGYLGRPHQHMQRTGKRGPAPKGQLQIETIAQLPKAQQRFVSQMLDTVLTQAQR